MSPVVSPSSTYRLQLHGDFGFRRTLEVVPYLRGLGVTHLYVSPVFRSRAGSPHGYDVVDPTTLDPELGSEEEFEALVDSAHAAGMGIIVDIVPNHMALDADNPFWMDVLEHGPRSPWASWFDIRWDEDSEGEGKVVVPFLGRPLREAIDAGELRPSIDARGPHVGYHEQRFPLAVRSCSPWCRRAADAMVERLGDDHPDVAAVRSLADRLEDPAVASRSVAVDRKTELVRLAMDQPAIRESLDASSGGPAAITALLRQQSYRLGYWKDETPRINYRRFFDIAHLIGIRVEDPDVLEDTHALVFELVERGAVDGLRVDHVDGLRDPKGYLQAVRARIDRRGTWLGVEKILVGQERLASDWPVDGTTGYDFLRRLGEALVDPVGFGKLTETYRGFTGDATSFHDVARRSRHEVLETLFHGELDRLVERLVAAQDEAALSLGSIRRAIVGLTLALPVYRTYVRNQGVPESDRRRLADAIAETRRRCSADDLTAVDLVEKWLLQLGAPEAPEPSRSDWISRWQQLTGPVTAKGVEDTALYRYLPLVSLNDVGAEPEVEPAPVQAFHDRNAHVRSCWPRTLSATATHDTKRGEDVRARLHVLGELHDEWESRLTRWSRWNASRRSRVAGHPVPDSREEILVYQTLLGAWPAEDAGGGLETFADRVADYLVKAAREAKLRSSWLNPDETHERALADFARRLIAEREGPFHRDFLEFQRRLAWYGALNSLSQVVLKIASPGIPDVYQGCELWDLSLVDPDNRRPVDFLERARRLEEIHRRWRRDPGECIRGLLEGWLRGGIKLFTTWRALTFRRARPRVFASGRYVPLEATGERSSHVIAFARSSGRSWVVAAVTRLPTALAAEGTAPIGVCWKDTELRLPPGCPTTWTDAFAAASLSSRPASDGGHRLALSEVFARLPVAMLGG